MNIPLLPSRLLILVVAACLVWIGLLSAAVVVLMGAGLSVGWVIGGALIGALAVWLVVMGREYRNAVDDPEDFETDELGETQADPASPATLRFTTVADLQAYEDAVAWGMSVSKRNSQALTSRTTPSVRPGRRSAVPRDGAPMPQGIGAGARG